MSTQVSSQSSGKKRKSAPTEQHQSQPPAAMLVQLEDRDNIKKQLISIYLI